MQGTSQGAHTTPSVRRTLKEKRKKITYTHMQKCSPQSGPEGIIGPEFCPVCLTGLGHAFQSDGARPGSMFMVQNP